ncbi:MAG TPA: hypothetical protein VGD33_03835 [Chitinophagaceae bacterium]
MFKRTKGYVLLTLLVVTGLASQVKNETLRTQERRILLQQLKDSKKEFIASIEDLKNHQLDFKQSASSLSIRENIGQLNEIECSLWKIARKKLERESASNKAIASDFKDDGIKNLAGKASCKRNLVKGNCDQIEKQFKDSRAVLIKYVRTTTEDVRKQVVETPYGQLDIYQVLLLITAETERITLEIEKLKQDPSFPKS